MTMEYLEIIWSWGYLFFTGLGALYIENIVVALIVIVTILGSAFISATIAEMRGHTMLKHFLAGTLLPVAYPIMINKKLPHLANESKAQKSELGSEVRNEINMRMAKVQYELACKKLSKKGLPIPDFIDWFDESKSKKSIKSSETATKDNVTEKTNKEQFSGINRAFIENLAVDNSGNRQGPFRIVLSDGRELIAQQVKNVMDEIATFEIFDNHGTMKNIRFKYNNIVLLERTDS